MRLPCAKVVLAAAVACYAFPVVGCRSPAGSPRPTIGFTTPEQELPAQLVSELAGSSGEVEASFSLTNSSSVAAEVVFQGTSCGCTGAFVGGGRLKPGDKVAVEGGSAVQVNLRSRPGGAAGYWSYRASFAQADKPDQEPMTATLHIRALRDVALEPGVLSCDFENADARELERTMTVTRTYRAERPSLRPQSCPT